MNSMAFRRVTRDDFPLLAHPHVERWWNHGTAPAAVYRFDRPSGQRARSTRPSSQTGSVDS